MSSEQIGTYSYPDLQRCPERVSNTIKLFHRTSRSNIPQIMQEGLRPHGDGHHLERYGFVNGLVDEFLPESLQQQGLSRSNAVFGWHIVQPEVGLSKKEIYLAFTTDKSNVFIGDYYKSNILLDGFGVLLSSCIDEELKKISFKLSPKEKKRTTNTLARGLFTPEIIEEYVSKLPERIRGELGASISRVQGKMKRLGEGVAKAYWGTVIPFQRFEKEYRYNDNGVWVSVLGTQAYGLPEAMVTKPVPPENIEVLAA